MREESTAEEVVSCGHIITCGPSGVSGFKQRRERGGISRSAARGGRDGARRCSAGVRITAHLAAGSCAPFFSAPRDPLGPEQVRGPTAKMSPFRSHRIGPPGTYNLPPLSSTSSYLDTAFVSYCTQLTRDKRCTRRNEKLFA